MAGNAFLGGVRNLMTIPETIGVAAGNLFFDVGASGGEILANPNRFLQGVYQAAVNNDQSLAAEYERRRAERRDALPTLEPTSITKAAQKSAVDAVMKATGADVLVNTAMYKYPSETEALAQFVQTPGVQAVMHGAEALGLPVTKGANAIVKAVARDINAPSVVDTVGGALMARMVPGSDVAMTGYHGSGAKFDRFSNDFMGTGEGAQAFGHGMYFAENKGIAKGYAGPGKARDVQPDGFSQIEEDMANEMMRVQDAGDYDRAAVIEELLINRSPSKAKSRFSEEPEKLKIIDEYADRFEESHLYEVDIPDEQIDKMLDWDKPLSEQPSEIQESVKNAFDDIVNRTDDYHVASDLSRQFEGVDFATETGGDLYDRLMVGIGKERGGYDRHKSDELQKIASERLSELGIPGIKYFDATSRDLGEGTRNFVVFKPEDLKILKRNQETVGQTIDAMFK